MILPIRPRETIYYGMYYRLFRKVDRGWQPQWSRACGGKREEKVGLYIIWFRYYFLRRFFSANRIQNERLKPQKRSDSNHFLKRRTFCHFCTKTVRVYRPSTTVFPFSWKCKLQMRVESIVRAVIFMPNIQYDPLKNRWNFFEHLSFIPTNTTIIVLSYSFHIISRASYGNHLGRNVLRQRCGPAPAIKFNQTCFRLFRTTLRIVNTIASKLFCIRLLPRSLSVLNLTLLLYTHDSTL